MEDILILQCWNPMYYWAYWDVISIQSVHNSEIANRNSLSTFRVLCLKGACEESKMHTWSGAWACVSLKTEICTFRPTWKVHFSPGQFTHKEVKNLDWYHQEMFCNYKWVQSNVCILYRMIHQWYHNYICIIVYNQNETILSLFDSRFQGNSRKQSICLHKSLLWVKPEIYILITMVK